MNGMLWKEEVIGNNIFYGFIIFLNSIKPISPYLIMKLINKIVLFKIVS